MVHYADSDRSRLSLGPVKQRGLDRFWLRWAPVMTSATSRRHLQRAKDYFSWIPPMESADDAGATDDAGPSDSNDADEEVRVRVCVCEIIPRCRQCCYFGLRMAGVHQRVHVLGAFCNTVS